MNSLASRRRILITGPDMTPGTPAVMNLKDSQAETA